MKAKTLVRTLSVVACLLAASWAPAATFSVNSYVDSVDATPGDGICADTQGRCTLRAAILEANALAGADTILAPPGVYNMTIGGADEDLGRTGDMDIRSDITLIGLGTTRLESSVGRVMHIISGNVSITGLTLVNGDANNDIGSGKAGGAVHNTAGSTLTLNNCTVITNTAQGGGGGIYNAGTLTLNKSTMTLNSSLGSGIGGGAVFNVGAMLITNSTLSANSATGPGGGILSAPGSSLTMNNVTVSNNSATSSANGGGLAIDATATATLANTILANNTASGTAKDCLGTIVTNGGNLVEVPTGCVGLGANDKTGMDPILGPLQNNGGPTLTHALTVGSPAINAAGFLACELTDQRGLARPQGPQCDIGSYEFFPNCPAVTVNPATLPNGDPGVFYTQTITASGGVTPYSFALTSGTLPDGLALNATTGVISGVPTTVGVFNFTVTAFDANFCRGTRAYTVTIGNPCNGVTITLAPTSLPDGTQATPYSQQITATGGTAPYQYTITAGALPTGLSLNLTTGVISGTPTVSGTFFFVVTATDANLCTGSQAYVLIVDCFLDVQPAALPNGTEGVAYNQTMTVANGVAPFTFAVISGQLPPGLTLTGAGVLAGTPTAPGTYTFVIEATDANNCTGARGYTIVIAPCLVVTPDTLPGGTVGTAYSQQLTATGGTPPITFTTTGPLPAGLALSTSGLISGTPTAGGISLFTVDVSASGGCTTSKDYYIVVNPTGCPAISISPATLPDGTVGQNYNQNLTASGGSAPYTFTLLTGDFPAGLALSAGGSLTGTPTESGIFTFTVAATDSNGCHGTRTITVKIFPVNCPLIALFPSTLPNAQIGFAYSQTLTATGGLAPYTYTVNSGSLPPGLTLNATTGVLSGTPTTSGTYTFSIRATDSALCFSNTNYTLSVTAGLFAAALVLSSDASGVWEPAETVTIAPAWRNGSTIGLSNVTGTLSTTDTTITLTDTSATYGTIAAGATRSCTDGADCYGATASGPRPSLHWDAIATELLSTANSKAWRLHVGESFADVPKTNPFYRFIETLLHKGVTGGCSATNYCPSSSTTRDSMAVFVLVAKEGAGYAPPACGTPMFLDVPASSPFCKWVEELARRGVVSGCGGGNYCPASAVTREAMAVFVLRTLDPTLNPPACTTPMFADVPASSPFCKWIEELARRGVVTGCGGGNYCPSAPVTREQMGVFLSATFGLKLYAP